MGRFKTIQNMTELEFQNYIQWLDNKIEKLENQIDRRYKSIYDMYLDLDENELEKQLEQMEKDDLYFFNRHVKFLLVYNTLLSNQQQRKDAFKLKNIYLKV